MASPVHNQEFPVGSPVGYQGLGAGIVRDRLTREFKGQPTTFAVIYFPHRDLSIQIPVSEDGVLDKLRPLTKPKEMKQLLESLSATGQRLSRTWDDREESGTRRLRAGAPPEWAAILRDYATAARSGLTVAASDADIVREAIDLLAAEVAAVEGGEFNEARERVRALYEAASGRKGRKNAAAS